MEQVVPPELAAMEEEEELLVTTATSVSLSARTSWPPLPTDPPRSLLLTGWFIQMDKHKQGQAIVFRQWTYDSIFAIAQISSFEN